MKIEKLTLAQQVIKSIDDNPEDWYNDDRTFNNDKLGIQVWIDNIPILNLDLYRPSRKFNLLEKIKIYLAIKRWNKRPLKFKGEYND